MCVNNTFMTENNDDDYDRGTKSRDSFFFKTHELCIIV